MKIDKAAIRSFLETNPTSGEINTILYTLAEYQAKSKKINDVWKQQLPTETWGSVKRLELFRDIICQLQSQGISISYHRAFSEIHTHYWRLRKGAVKGGLTWNIEDDRFTLWLFDVIDENGVRSPRFTSVNYQSFCEWW